MEKDEVFKKRIQDLSRTAYQRDIVTFTDFLDLHEQHIVHSLTGRLQGTVAKSFGGYEMSERQITAFLPDALSYEWEYPIACLCIEPKASRFAEALTHRDYLGALLNLGIERSMLGDILQDGQKTYVYCIERMADYIIRELARVRHTTVTVVRAEDYLPDPERRLEAIKGTIASVRLDALVALAFSSSRSRILPLIESGKVFVNGKMVTSNGSSPREGDLISVRGMGKFRFDGVLSITKKGRCLAQVSRFR